MAVLGLQSHFIQEIKAGLDSPVHLEASLKDFLSENLRESWSQSKDGIPELQSPGTVALNQQRHIVHNQARAPLANDCSLIVSIRAIVAAAVGTSSTRLEGKERPLGERRTVAVPPDGKAVVAWCWQNLHVREAGAPDFT